MGISSNQARLLALTSRKCDLEAQMQLLLHRKLNIAKETTSIANSYNEAISNRELVLFDPVSTNAPDFGDNMNMYKNLDVGNLWVHGGNLLVVEKTPTGYQQISAIYPTADQVEEGLRNGSYALVTFADEETQNPQTIDFTNVYNGGNYLGLGATGKYEVVDWRSSTKFLDRLDQSDDGIAQANYERLMNELKEKESQMDVEINSIETQHSAISNELETTKKVMTKNTEDSFKYFS